MHITVKQGIDNCYLAHQYEHPGYEEDRCAEKYKEGYTQGVEDLLRCIRRGE